MSAADAHADGQRAVVDGARPRWDDLEAILFLRTAEAASVPAGSVPQTLGGPTRRGRATRCPAGRTGDGCRIAPADARGWARRGVRRQVASCWTIRLAAAVEDPETSVSFATCVPTIALSALKAKIAEVQSRRRGIQGFQTNCTWECTSSSTGMPLAARRRETLRGEHQREATVRGAIDSGTEVYGKHGRPRYVLRGPYHRDIWLSGVGTKTSFGRR